MSELIRTKLRRIGTSYGFIVPKKAIDTIGMEEGEEIDVAIFKKIKKDMNLINKAFGMAKGAKPFVRDRAERKL
ncbi:MAG TPA: hypothetical protein VJK03_04760 [Candidatus Nanoarchaeia archaeon]|nr:hypothetical protein [Candidatus Nanoarchaeia archaeon]